MRKHIVIAVATFLLVVGAVLSSIALSAHGHGDGEDPPWVGPDNFVPHEDLPDEFPVYDSDGKVAGRADVGEEIERDAVHPTPDAAEE